MRQAGRKTTSKPGCRWRLPWVSVISRRSMLPAPPGLQSTDRPQATPCPKGQLSRVSRAGIPGLGPAQAALCFQVPIQHQLPELPPSQLASGVLRQLLPGRAGVGEAEEKQAPGQLSSPADAEPHWSRGVPVGGSPSSAGRGCPVDVHTYTCFIVLTRLQMFISFKFPRFWAVSIVGPVL